MTPQEVERFVRTAIECSVYIAPLEPGLTRSELQEVGKRESPQDLADIEQLRSIQGRHERE